MNLILGDFALLPPLLSHCPVLIHFRVSACTSQSHPKNLLSGCEEPLTSSVFVRRWPDRVHTQTSTATRHACAAAAHNKAGLSHPSAFHRGSCISILLFSKRNCRQLKSSWGLPGFLLLIYVLKSEWKVRKNCVWSHTFQRSGDEEQGRKRNEVYL